eukprot:gnl/MRDRNA2_/MRDRNA2_19681_c0_seq1.p1 gnl/MRDRNA2_/MRDRNA2_19681_c0~~gnl/MRDRNA2_/MRDRNA2_19681_c0_seq1.p1  ORF type:complete len:340 (+),score=69.06 gnl/MRDRNA2_/MRDRNA2_19681_c0_seq1:57-1076(+)
MKPTKELGEIYNVPIFRDIKDLSKSDIANSVDGIIIASSHASHFPIAVEALNKGWHILMEKPMTADVNEAHSLVAELNRIGGDKTFMVNNSANFREQAIRAHKLVQNGEVGKVEHVGCYMIRERGFFDHPENTAWCRPTGTMVGNGFAWGQLSHTLAWVYMVTGLSPVSVFCHMGFSTQSGADLYDSASVKCSNGGTISVQGVASMPGAALKSGKLIENKIFGTEGCLFYSGDDVEKASGSLELMRHDGKNQSFPGFDFENTSQEGDGPESLKAFIGACLGRPFFNAADAAVGLKVVQTIDAMYKSAKSGKVEKICERSDGGKKKSVSKKPARARGSKT